MAPFHLGVEVGSNSGHQPGEHTPSCVSAVRRDVSIVTLSGTMTPLIERQVAALNDAEPALVADRISRLLIGASKRIEN